MRPGSQSWPLFFLRPLNDRALKNKGGALFTSQKQRSIVGIIENNLFVIEMIANVHQSVFRPLNPRVSSTSSTGFVESKLSGVDVYNALLWMLKELYQARPYKSRPASEVGALNKLCKFSRKDNNRECRNSVILCDLEQAQDVTTCFSECKNQSFVWYRDHIRPIGTESSNCVNWI